MANDPADQISELLQARCGVQTLATLVDGQTVVIHNIAWGRDIGDVLDHIMTNISPSPECPHTLDFFFTEKVALLVAPESGAVLFRRADHEA